MWHQRLGHASRDALAYIPDIDFQCNTNCAICHAAKQCRLSFPKSNTKTNGIFQMLHIDLWGPYHLQSIIGARYLLTIVDDYSRATWVIMLQSKTQTTNALQIFFEEH